MFYFIDHRLYSSQVGRDRHLCSIKIESQCRIYITLPIRIKMLKKELNNYLKIPIKFYFFIINCNWELFILMLLLLY